MNNVSLIAHLTEDPKPVRTVQTKTGETVVTDLRVAYNDPFAPDDAPADYFTVTVWGSQATNAVAYLSKGREVGIVGQLKHKPWKSKGDETHNDVVIVARQLDYLRVPKGAPEPSPDADHAPVPDGDDIPF